MPYDLPKNAYFSFDNNHRWLFGLQGDYSVGSEGIIGGLPIPIKLRDYLYWSLILQFKKYLDEWVFPNLFKLKAITPVCKSVDSIHVVYYM